MPPALQQIRNIGIVAHIDAGKTTVTERMLFFSKASHRLGDVDRGTTITDFDPEEQERGITIYSAAVSFQWNDITVNLIDTPGHVDFTAEVERSLRVLDGAVVVFSAREGVEAQSETVWRQADKYGVPRICLINKLDREGADFFGTVRQIGSRLSAKPLVLQVPLGMGPPHVANPFRGLVDLISMQLITFSKEDNGATSTQGPIPQELLETATHWRDDLVSTLFDFSDEVAELALAEAPIPCELIRAVIREATIARRIVPVLGGSALDCIGVQPLLDAVASYLPSPADVPDVQGMSLSGKTEIAVRRPPDPNSPFCGLVFKIVADKHGDLHYVRIYSGTLKAGSRAWNPRLAKKENIAQLWHLQADRREQVLLCSAGDIIGVIGPRGSVTGDTLCDAAAPILLESICFPETVISMAIEPETSLERKKLSEVLDMMKRQDPTFRAVESEETGQTIISGMGELHLEVIRHRLEREFNLHCRVHRPRVSYKETVARQVVVEGQSNRQIAGQTLFATVRLRAEPTEDQSAVQTVQEWFPQDASSSHVAAVMVTAIGESTERGGLKGCPLWSTRFTLLESPLPDPLPSDVAIRIAAADAVDKAIFEAGTVLLEPIMKLEVSVPEAHLGDVINDLQQRRAVITNTYLRAGVTVIEAESPLSSLFGYSAAVRSVSQGRASFTMSPLKYGPASAETAESFV
ncbi:MAG: elongation factor G [Planctomycetota bacterium]|jgi:elongation factor G|nr:elongation factor G [Pirellulales bacterium]RLS59260.1 MAG: elongation factor G [Planctomycetota bacterium]